jgi:hypothetical protein
MSNVHDVTYDLLRGRRRMAGVGAIASFQFSAANDCFPRIRAIRLLSSTFLSPDVA